VTGQVRLNGKAMSPAQLRLLSGYVVQEDILPGLLSVRECIEFQAQLRVPGSMAQRAQRVDAVLQRLKLVRQQDTPIGSPLVRGISGGEKRRVSVAIELLSEPAVLFLDEPTTGQDSTTAVSEFTRTHLAMIDAFSFVLGGKWLCASLVSKYYARATLNSAFSRKSCRFFFCVR